ncbi:Non-reducing end beta-L-arabinofuranosidase [mine drainage metagenome]|uniref:Non-reducing end beta-L-arabinofuranosidase n=1 Tax=mine drainage metagenome TaxID=410659 RepID=A0A1J5TKF9_9ZZZZ
MKKIAFILMVFAGLTTNAQQKDYLIKAVDFTKVKLTDHFWLPRIEINRTITIPASFARCESTGRVKNFVMAAARKGKFCTHYPFDDTDIYKTIEGASFSLATHPDAELQAYLDSLINIIAKAQEADGYLYTARTIDPNNVGSWVGKVRWEKERELSHELYNAGHLYEAAAAHYLATKKTNLLNIALKNADLVCSVFGPGKKSVAPGHEIVEMGLVKLYRITGKKEYLNTAKFFIEARGHYKGYNTKSDDSWLNGSYWQDDKPVVLQDEAEGHAVRAGYLYSAVADVAALTGDDSLLHAIDKIWENVVTKKMYVQGSVGAKGDGERFGKNYELPNATAYNETCAAIANVFWNERMFLLHGDSKYIDVLEKTLYNGLISGIGLDGKSFFYTNAMQVTNNFNNNEVEVSRSGWFDCSCCPTNLVRLIPSVPGYVYAQQDNNVYANLFINGTSELVVEKNSVEIIQQNNYPWNGDLSFTINPSKATEFNFKVRIPGWAQNTAIPSDLYQFKNNSDKKIIIKINGQQTEYNIEKGYAVLNRKWKKGDVVEVNLPMEVRRVIANKIVSEDNGKVALQMGPIIYCAEWVDNDKRTSNIIMPSNADFTTEYKPGLLNGINVLKTNVTKVEVDTVNNKIETVVKPFVAIPYYAWANRGKGEMAIWLDEKIKDVELITGN